VDLLTRKPSVLMISYQYAPASDGGAARQAQLLAESLAARGRRVGVATARFPRTLAFERIAGVEVHRVWAIPEPGRFSATFIPSLARFLLFNGRRYDIWHAHQAFYNAGVALRLARVLGRKCIVKDAASGPFGDMARLRHIRLGEWVRQGLIRADGVISLNAEMTEELQMAGVSPTRIYRIPNGVDCDGYRPPSPDRRRAARAALGIPPNGVLALFAGRLAEDKGTEYLLDGWRRVEERSSGQPWSLVVAGEALKPGEYRERWEDALHTARFVGKVPDVRPLLHAADVLVHPSLSEGFSNIVLEAMACGLPVVGTRTAALNEQVEDGVTGLLVPPRDAEALAGAIVEILPDAERRARMGHAGRLRAQSRYAIPSILDAYEEMYDHLMIAPGNSGPEARHW
jgi:glycosyltransferase involved in cell wall biosynthesis